MEEQERERMSGQEITTKTSTRLKNDDATIKAGGILIRPNEKVTVEFNGSQFHKDGTREDIHPALAAKLIYTQKVCKLVNATEEQAKRVDEFKPAEAKAKKEK